MIQNSLAETERLCAAGKEKVTLFESQLTQVITDQSNVDRFFDGIKAMHAITDQLTNSQVTISETLAVGRDKLTDLRKTVNESQSLVEEELQRVAALNEQLSFESERARKLMDKTISTQQDALSVLKEQFLAKSTA